MIGDGITDLEACPPADAFIGKLINNLIMKVYKAHYTTYTKYTYNFLISNHFS